MVLGLSYGQEHEGLDWLIESVPGVPGEDYPIYAEVPDTGFTCDGQVEGGKYADPGAECQVKAISYLGEIYLIDFGCYRHSTSVPWGTLMAT